MANESDGTRPRIEIFAAEDGWPKTDDVVKKVLRQMACEGLRSDWWFCSATSDHYLIFCDGGSDPAQIEARKRGRKWEFFTDSGYKVGKRRER